MICFSYNFTWEFVTSVEVFRLGGGIIIASGSADISGKKK